MPDTPRPPSVTIRSVVPAPLAEAIHHAAADAGQNLSEYLRECALRDLTARKYYPPRARHTHAADAA